MYADISKWIDLTERKQYFSLIKVPVQVMFKKYTIQRKKFTNKAERVKSKYVMIDELALDIWSLC